MSDAKDARNDPSGPGRGHIDGCAFDAHHAELLSLLNSGHEVLSHSGTHPHLTVDNAGPEIVDSKRKLEDLLGAGKVSFFAFPYDEVNAGVMDLARDAGSIGARGGWGDNGLNRAELADPFHLQFDVFGPNSVYGDYLADPAHILNVHVDAAVMAGGWAVCEVQDFIGRQTPPRRRWARSDPEARDRALQPCAEATTCGVTHPGRGA